MDDGKFVEAWQNCFPEPESVGPRPWGEETILAVGKGEILMKSSSSRRGPKADYSIIVKESRLAILFRGK